MSYITKDLFQGVYAIDQLPSYQPVILVLNTDEHGKSEEQWVTVYDNEYFDSYGYPPMDQRLVEFLQPGCTYNNVTLQLPLSIPCGFYCIYYFLQHAREQCAEDIIVLLKHTGSDIVVKHMICDRYKPLFHSS